MIGADISDLRKIGLSDILDDDWTRAIYSVDASHCTVKPLAVNFPLTNMMFRKYVILPITAVYQLPAGVRAQDC